jgi:hypothetical protein
LSRQFGILSRFVFETVLANMMALRIHTRQGRDIQRQSMRTNVVNAYVLPTANFPRLPLSTTIEDRELLMADAVKALSRNDFVIAFAMLVKAQER